MRRNFLLAAMGLICFVGLRAQAPVADAVRRYVSVDAPVVAITNVRLVDGTGAPAREGQTVIIAGGLIRNIAATTSLPAPAGARVLDGSGYTLLPGLVGMHNHLYYTASLNRNESGTVPAPGIILNEIPFTGPRLYLACGVTTMRTTGSLEPYTDLNVKQAIDSGKMPGPKLHLTAPYLEGPPGGSVFPQMHELTGAADARKMVAFWADAGFTSFKAYMHITRAELQAAVEEAHKRKLKLTAHLCSVGYREAAGLGVDNLEHGFVVDTEFTPGKKPDDCPPPRDAIDALVKMDINGAEVQNTFRTLIQHQVAITSTLPVFESSAGTRPPLQQRVLDAMSPESRISYLTARARGASGSGRTEGVLKKAMEYERAFVKAGGLLVAGPDPTGNGGVLPGFGDQREIELLVEAGFTPLEAIRIATYNGAIFLGVADRVGSIAEGKQADLILIKGDPTKNISDIEKVETVFKDGVGYNSQALIESVRGQVGVR